MKLGLWAKRRRNIFKTTLHSFWDDLVTFKGKFHAKFHIWLLPLNLHEHHFPHQDKSCTPKDQNLPMSPLPQRVSPNHVHVMSVPCELATENPPYWWYLPGKIGIFHGYVSLPAGRWWLTCWFYSWNTCPFFVSTWKILRNHQLSKTHQ